MLEFTDTALIFDPNNPTPFKFDAFALVKSISSILSISNPELKDLAPSSPVVSLSPKEASVVPILYTSDLYSTC